MVNSIEFEFTTKHEERNMVGKIVNTGAKMKRIENTGEKMPRVDPELVAAALGAERIPDEQVDSSNPLSMYALRAELFRRLQSTGGRPALEGTTRRPKIPVSDQEWQELESIAAAVTQED